MWFTGSNKRNLKLRLLLDSSCQQRLQIGDCLLSIKLCLSCWRSWLCHCDMIFCCSWFHTVPPRYGQGLKLVLGCVVHCIKGATQKFSGKRFMCLLKTILVPREGFEPSTAPFWGECVYQIAPPGLTLHGRTVAVAKTNGATLFRNPL